MIAKTPLLFLIGSIWIAPLLILAFAGLDDVRITCSLYHDAPLDNWWPDNSWKFGNITLEEFKAFPFPDGLTQIDSQFLNVSP